MSTTAHASPANRNRLLSSCAVAAIALAAQAQPAQAQVNGGFNGTASAINATVPTGTGTIEVNGPRAIINWQANSNNFLAEGGVATFNGNSAYVVLNRITPVANTTTPIEFNGTVRSTLFGQQQGGNVWFYSPNGIVVGATGRFDVGSLLLTANPLTMTDNAFLGGGDSTFNFARADSNAGVTISPGAQISALGSNAYVALIAPRVRQSGSVTVNGTAAYVAAEDVSMTITGSLFDFAVDVARGSDGPSASDNRTLIHDGQTTLVDNDSRDGPDPFDPSYGGVEGDPRRAIMVAVPKNDAVTLLLSGGIDYRQATGALQADGKIILSGGYNVADGSIQGMAPDITKTANIGIENGFYEPRIEGAATGIAAATATSDGIAESVDLLFLGSVDLFGAGGSSLTANAGASAEVGGDLSLDVEGGVGPIVSASLKSLGGSVVVNGDLSLDAYTSGGSATGATSGRTAEIVANSGGGITISGGASLNAVGDGGFNFGPAGNGVGGTARIDVSDDASVTITGDATLDATGYGGRGEPGGNGQGGAVEVLATGGSIDAGSLTLVAEGYGGESGYGSGSYGNGTGGAVSVETGSANVGGVVIAGTIDVINGFQIRAGGFGGNEGFCNQCGRSGFASLADSGTGGVGQGGTVDMLIDGGRLAASFLSVDVRGVGGEGQFNSAASGGDGSPGRGGIARLTFADGSVALSSLSVDAGGYGGDGSDGGFAGEGILDGGRGGDGIGGEIALTASTASPIQLGFAGLSARGEGGDGGRIGFGSGGGIGGRGGDAIGGVATLSIERGLISAGSVQLDVTAFGGSNFNFSEGGFGGDGGDGGDALGGQAAIGVENARLETSFLNVRADAFGGEGGQGLFKNDGAGGAGGKGGTGDGGGVSVEARAGGTLALDNASLSASGEGGFAGRGGSGSRGGDGGAGGDGLGGSVDLLVATGGGVFFSGEGGLDIEAEGDGGRGEEGGFGNVAGDTGGIGGAGGGGIGGSAAVRVTGGTAVLVETEIDVDATGGDGAEGGEGAGVYDPETFEELQPPIPAQGGIGGNAKGGSALIEAVGATASLTLNGFTELNAIGGDRDAFDSCCGDSPLGGTGTGGSAAIEASDGASIETGDDVDLLAFGRGGSGVQGGDGFGGNASIVSSASDININGDLTLDARSFGGVTYDFEGRYGDGSGGGLATLEIASVGGIAGRIGSRSVTLDVSGEGGAESSGCDFFCERAFAVAATGGSGGGGKGGTATVIIDGIIEGYDDGESTVEQANVRVDARGVGSDASSFVGDNAGSDGIGGSIAIDFRGQSNQLASLDLDARGFGGDAAEASNDPQGDPVGAGGTGTGGTINLGASGGTAKIDDLSITAEGFGGEGGRGVSNAFGGTGDGGVGGDGGAGSGGSVLIDAGTGGILTLPAEELLVSGFGGRGGSGGQPGTGGAGGTGGTGGHGKGGAVELRSSGGRLTVFSETVIDDGYGTVSTFQFGPTLRAEGHGGDGGQGGFESGDGVAGGLGGAGGHGDGGIALMNAVAGDLDAGPADLFVGGTGGSGGFGGSSFNFSEGGPFDGNGTGGAGGMGGKGSGGTAELRTGGGALEIVGIDTVTDPDGTSSVMDGALVDAFGYGGNGGGGGTGLTGGKGGDGGIGQGGSALAGSTGGTLSVGLLIATGDALGGAGGIGGDGTTRGDSGGIGGDGGDGSAGSAAIRVVGGRFESRAYANLGSIGQSGDGGAGGFGRPSEMEAAGGAGGNGAGGAVSIAVGDGTGAEAGSAEIAGFVGLYANGTGGDARSGSVQIVETAAAATGSLSVFGPVFVQALGANSPGHVGFLLTTTDGPLALGSVDVEVDQNASFAGTRSGSVVAGFFDVEARGSILLAQESATAGVSLLNAADDVLLTAGGAILGKTAGVAAGRDVVLRAPGAIQLGSATAGDDVDALSSGGDIDIGTARTTGLGPDISETGYGPGDGSNIVLDSSGAIRLDNGDAVDRIALDARGGRIDSAGLLTAVRLDADAATSIALTDVDVIDALTLSTPNGFVSGRNFMSDGTILVRARDGITLAGANAANFVDLGSSGGNIAAGIIAAGEDIVANTAVGTITLANGTALRDILLAARGNINVTTAQAGDDFVATSTNGAVVAGSVVTTGLGQAGPRDGSNIVVEALNDVTLDNGDAADAIRLTSLADSVSGAGLLQAIDLSVDAADNIALTDLDIVNDIDLTASGGSISGRDFQSQGSISLDAAATIDLGGLDAGDQISVRTDADTLLGTVSAGSDIAVEARAITLAAGDAGGDIDLTASDAIVVGSAQAGNDFTAIAGTNFVGTSILAGAGTIAIEANGRLALVDGEARDAIRLTSLTGSVESTGLLKATDLFVEAGDNIALNDIEIVNDLSLRAANGAISGSDTFRSGGSISLEAAATIDVETLDAGGFISVRSNADAIIGTAKAGSDIEIAARNIALASADAGSGISLDATGGIDLASATAVASVEASADGAAKLGTVRAGADIVASGASVTLTDGMAGRDIDLTSPGAINVGFAQAGDDFTGTAGTSFIGTTVITTGEGDDSEGETGYGTLTQAAVGDLGSNIVVDANGAIALANGDAHDALRLTSATGSVASSDRLNAGSSLLLQSATSTGLAEAIAGDVIDIMAGGALTGGVLTAGGALRIGAGGNVTLATATATDDIDIDASGASAIDRLTTTGPGADVLVASDGGITINTLDASGSANLLAATGNVLVSNDLKAGGTVDASGRAVTLNAVGPLSVRSANASAGNVGLISGGNLTVQAAQASGNVAATSGAALALNGDVNGTQLMISSRDIAIGQAARVGTTARTTAIDITANGGAVVIGGTGTSSGYRLDSAEFGRLAGRDINIRNADSASGVRIEGLTVRGSAATSPNLTGRLTIVGNGDVTMAGKLAVENAGTANGVRVSAGNGFFADAATSGIAVTNAEALAGSIDIDARSITVASQSAVADLGSAGTVAARSDRLGRNDGAEDKAGFLRAGGIRLAASERIHVQNSGIDNDLPDDRAGLTAGSGGISLVTTGQALVEVIINGREDNGSGGFVTGRALIPALTLTDAEGGPARIAAGSTVNGCLITGAPCGQAVVDPIIIVGPVVQDVIEDLLEDEGDGLTRPPVLAFGQLISVEGGPLLPVIDDPVTGTGNDDIWSPANAPGLICEDDRQDCVIDQPVTGSGNEDLQRGVADETPPTTVEPRPDGGVIDAPVTGTGNENLQADDGEDEG